MRTHSCCGPPERFGPGSLFDPAFPLANGESGGFVVSNGLRSTLQLQ